jgi:hypothetical protein
MVYDSENFRRNTTSITTPKQRVGKGRKNPGAIRGFLFGVSFQTTAPGAGFSTPWGEISPYKSACTAYRSRPSRYPMTPLASFATPPVLVVAYVLAMLLTARFADTRGRSGWTWGWVAGLITPPLAVVWLWFLPDLKYEQQRTREFLAAAKQRRHRQEPTDPFSRARDRQEQEIQTKAITARRLREQPLMPPPPNVRRLRALENRTPATLIMNV